MKEPFLINPYRRKSRRNPTGLMTVMNPPLIPTKTIRRRMTKAVNKLADAAESIYYIYLDAGYTHEEAADALNRILNSWKKK